LLLTTTAIYGAIGLCGVKMTSPKQMVEHFMTSGHLTVAAGVKQALEAIEELGAM
jgi:hypothetical protein